MKRRRDKNDLLFPLINSAVLIVFALLCLYPMLFILFASFSEPKRIMIHSGLLFHPLGFTFEGYRMAFKNPNILTGYANTLFYVSVGTVSNLLCTASGAYVLSRRDVMLAKPIMMGIVFTMYFSGGLIPLYLQMNAMRLNNTRGVIVLVSLISAWNLIVMRTSFQGIPDTMEESAKIDGAGPITTFIKIYLPLSLPMLATMALFYGVGHWNSWFNHMIFLRDRVKFPLQLIMREILVSNDMSSMTNLNAVGTYASDMYQVLVKYSVVVIATAPILMMYPLLQKYFIKGVMVGAIKG